MTKQKDHSLKGWALAGKFAFFIVATYMSWDWFKMLIYFTSGENADALSSFITLIWLFLWNGFVYYVLFKDKGIREIKK